MELGREDVLLAWGEPDLELFHLGRIDLIRLAFHVAPGEIGVRVEPEQLQHVVEIAVARRDARVLTGREPEPSVVGGIAEDHDAGVSGGLHERDRVADQGGADAAFLKRGRDADRAERRNRDARAVLLLNGAHGVPDAARGLAVELGDEAESRQIRRVLTKLVDQEMFARAGAVDVPEGVADQVFHGGMVGGLFGTDDEICHGGL